MKQDINKIKKSNAFTASDRLHVFYKKKVYKKMRLKWPKS